MSSLVQIIGVTGGVGSGKSTFARELERLGACLLDADAVARELMETRTDIQFALRETFGGTYFDASGALKRRDLGKLVFTHPDELEKLNQIVWPALLDKIQTQIKAWRASSRFLIGVVDMAILFEAGVADWFDQVVVVTASTKNRKQRLKTSRGWRHDEIESRITAQLSEPEKILRADLVVQNDGPLDALLKHADDYFRSIKRTI